jgi:integrase
VVPLSSLAIQILQGVPRVGPYVFAYKLDKSASLGYTSKWKVALDKVLAASGAATLPQWTPHDCRRTFRTGLAALGIPDHIGERLINHAVYQSEGGHRISKMDGVYNHHPYEAEKRAAMDRWDA